MPTIALFVRSPDVHAYIAAGVDAAASVMTYRSIAELLDAIASPSVALVVTEAGDERGLSNAPAIAAVRARNERLPIVVVCRVAAGSTQLVADVVRAGATGLLFRGVDDSRYAIRTALQQAVRQASAQRVHEVVLPLLPTAALPFLRYAIARSADEPTVAQAARDIGVDRKTLLNWLGGTRVTPTEFLNWIRLSLAVGALEGTATSAERIALDLGFPSGTAFRNMLRRYSGRTSGDLRAAGSFDYMLETFREQLAAEPRTPMTTIQPAVPQVERWRA